MSDRRASLKDEILPKPIQLTPEAVRRVAAGSAAALLSGPAQTIICGPYPAGPLSGAANVQSIVNVASLVPLLAGANVQFGG
jgi:hypothetical protein